MNYVLIKKVYREVIVFILIVVFSHTAYNKFYDLKSIQDSLLHYPIVGNFPVFFSWAIPVVESIVVILLIIPKLKLLGLIGSISLLAAFTVYILYMMVIGSDLPCTCGGMIEALSWKQHIYFNTTLIVLSILSVIFTISISDKGTGIIRRKANLS